MSTETSNEPLTFTREELYEKVWTEAMAILAPKLGMSDVGLKKNCARLRVPTPPRGYWAKIAAGQRPRRTPLPKLPASVSKQNLTVTFRQPPKPSPAVAVEEDTGPVGAQRKFEAVPENHVTVADQLTNPHPLVARSVHLLRKTKADEQLRLRTYGLKCVALKVTLGSVDRALRIYDALFKALTVRGHRVELLEKENNALQTVVHIGEDAVPIEIMEPVTRTELPKQKSAYAWESKQYSYEATGRLSLVMVESYLDVRGKWSDGARQRLDEMLNDVIVGLVAAAEAMKARRARWAQAELERQAEEARRNEREERQRREHARVRALDLDMRRLRKARAVRDYVSQMRVATTNAEAAGAARNETLQAWLTWADGYADRLDPTTSPTVPDDPDPHAEYRSSWQGPSQSELRPIW
jgi:hypothetical protein